MHGILGETVNWGILDINSVLYWVKGKRHGKWGKMVNQGITVECSMIRYIIVLFDQYWEPLDHVSHCE